MTDVKTTVAALVEALDEASGNINPERGFADELEDVLTQAVITGRKLLIELEAAPAQAEPVAWQWRRKGDPWSLEKTFFSEVFATTDDSEVRPLYAAPQPTRGPLTEAESAQIVREASRGAATRRDGTTSTRIIRAVEAAHGITGEKQQ